MKKRKKYWICLFLMLLFVSEILTDTVNAKGTPSLSASADAAGVEKGSFVNVRIDLSGNPSISTLGMALSYDSAVLSYDSVVWSGGFSGSDMQMASDTGSQVNLSVVCDSSYSADGTVATVRFHAISDTSFLPVTLSLRDMADADLNAVTGCKVSSQVRVPEVAEKKDNIKETALSKEKADVDSGAASLRQTVRGAGADAEQAASVQATVEAVAVDTPRVVLEQSSAQPDQNYKTGAGVGDDIFLIIAVLCGIFALILTVRKYGEEKK